MVNQKYLELLRSGKKIYIRKENEDTKNFINEIKNTVLINIKDNGNMYELQKHYNVTFNKLVTLCKKNLKLNKVTNEDLNNYALEELISNSTYDLLIDSINQVTNLSQKDIEVFKYNYYNEDYHNIEYVKKLMLLDAIDYQISGEKKTPNQIKKEMLKEIED